MPRAPTSRQALTIGQLAKRWGVSADRVRQLLQSGHFPEAFTIPSAGRYGATIKIPMATVLRVESEDWVIVEQVRQAKPKSRSRMRDSGPALRHFPNLAASPEPAFGSPAAAAD